MFFGYAIGRRSQRGATDSSDTCTPRSTGSTQPPRRRSPGWTDQPAAHERTGWRIRAAYLGSDVAFEVEYVVCQHCAIGWVESPYSYPGYERQGLASAALLSLRHAHPVLEWHTGGGHFRESEPFWTYVGKNIPGGYTQRERCRHVEPWRHTT